MFKLHWVGAIRVDHYEARRLEVGGRRSAVDGIGTDDDGYVY